MKDKKLFFTKKILLCSFMFVLIYLFTNNYINYNINNISVNKKDYKASHDTIYVSNDGHDRDSSDGSVSNPYNDLKQAFEDITDKGTIILKSDTESSWISDINKEINLKSYDNNQYTISFVSGLGYGIQLHNSKDILNIENVSIKGGSTSPGAALILVEGGGVLNLNSGAVLEEASTSAVNVQSNGTIVLNDGSEIRNNSAQYGGGGISLDNGKLIMNGGNIHNNTATWGGGILSSNNSSITIKGNSKLENNTSINENGNGGAISSNDSNIDISGNVTISGNKTQFFGGGIFIMGGKVNISNATLKNNEAVRDGGALRAGKAAVINIKDTTISNNKTTGSSGIYDRGGAIFAYDNTDITLDGKTTISNNESLRGGGLYLIDSHLTMKGDTSINSNTATANAGGLYITKENLESTSSIDADLESGSITNNVNTGTGIEPELVSDTEFAGGGVYIGPSAKVNIKNMVLNDNSISQDKFIGNRTSDKGIFAGGIGLCPDSTVFISSEESSLIYDNTKNGGADILFVKETSLLKGKEPSIYISYKTLGDGVYNWQDINGNYVSGGNLKIKGNFTTLKSNVSQEDISKGKAKGKLFVSGNSSNGIYGAGGIMCNGILKIGTEKETGGISVKKNLIGTDDKDNNEKFDFTVYLSDKNISGQYGDAKFENGVAKLEIGKDEVKNIINLPIGISYQVIENENKNYFTSYENNEGKIESGALNKIEINNIKKIRKVSVPDTSAYSKGIIFGITVILIGSYIIVTQLRKKKEKEG